MKEELKKEREKERDEEEALQKVCEELAADIEERKAWIHKLKEEMVH